MSAVPLLCDEIIRFLTLLRTEFKSFLYGQGEGNSPSVSGYWVF